MMNEVAQTLIELARKFAHRLQVAWGENLVSVVLYGSVARGECHKDSDVDLLVIAEELPESRLERTRLLLQQRDARGGDSAEKKTGFPIGLLKRWRF